MKRSLWIAGTFALVVASFALGAETRKAHVATYDAVADTILASKKAEKGIVHTVLDEHDRAARRAFDSGNWGECAAEMALFANEGDNQVGGIRKRLLAGGHHHNAEGEAKGVYEEGYVTVTRAAKTAILGAVAAMQDAKDDAGRKAAWSTYAAAADPLLR